MSEQPEALRLADALETYGPSPWANSAHQAADELRRLHEANQKLQQQLGEAVWNYGEKVRANQELLEALKLALSTLEGWAGHGKWVWPESALEQAKRNTTEAITAIREALAEESLGTEQPAQQCNPHPKAPHGFDRNASHSADRYVCECEGWDAYEAGYQAGIEKALEFDADPQPAQQQEPLTPREVELLDGMIEVQLNHASQCDGIANRAMAEKQKVWDMERVKLLRKLKAAHGIKGGA